MNETLLWYESAADSFNTALPVGNGRIGGMIYGKPYNEIICINEDSVWSGGKRNRINPDAKEGLNEIRQLLENENIKEAEDIAYRKLQGIPPVSRHYMPLANVNINMNLSGVAKEYKRGLDLETAISFVEFTTNGVKYTREVFVSEPDSVIVIHLTADGENLDLSANFDCIEDYFDDNRPADNKTLLITGGFGGNNGICFGAAMSAVSEDGDIYTEGDKLYIKNTQEAFILISAKSSFYADEAYADAALMDIEYAAECTYDELRYRHICDYKERFEKVKLNLNDNSGNEANLPTDERILRMRGNDLDDKECDNHIHDNGLMTLYFNFARYLMISGSRDGSQPLNFQGIWNDQLDPYCGGRFELNVNTQMDYWIAESCNLSECHQPLFDLLERVCECGKEIAREMYGCNGFVCHTATDIWGDCAPQGNKTPFSIWCMGGAWLCLHIFDRYEYTLDKEFLSKYYPIMREAAVFYTEYLTEDKNGNLIVTPSLSPENTYKTESGAVGTLSAGSSVDCQIISILFNDVIKTTDILDIDHEFSDKLKKMLEKLPEPQIGKFGQIMEWLKDFDETDTGHKFVSQLFSLHPAHIITPESTPRLADAARTTLIRRLIHGSGSGGISRAWVANMWARLYDSQMVYDNIRKLIAFSTNPNMFDGQPRIRVDGNFGGASAMVEALMQSSSKEINILPALPTEWETGEISGLRAKGGFEVSIKWKDKKLVSAEIVPSFDGQCTVRTKEIVSVSCDGHNVNSTLENGAITFDAKQGNVYTIRS